MANQPKKYQKFVATAATATLVATAVVPAASADSKFSDISTYAQEVQDEVVFLADLGVIKGFEDGTFKPSQNITRGQAVKMIGRFLEEQGIAEVPANWETVQSFDDIALNRSDRDLVKYAALVKAAGVFQGNGNVLNPSGFTTRENMALILDRLVGKIVGKTAVELAAGKTNNVADLAAAKEEAREAIKALNALGVSNAEEFKPKNNTQRVHFASFLARMIDLADSIVTKVDTVTVIDEKTIEVTFKTGEETETVQFTLENALQNGANEVTVTHKGVEYKLTVNYSDAPAESGSVVAATAINSSEIKVEFGKALNADALADAFEETGFNQIEVQVNGFKTTIQDIQVSEDGKTATLLIAGTLGNGDKYAIQTTDKILAKDGSLFEKYASETSTFNSVAAPAFVSSELTADGDLLVTFDRPVSTTADLGKGLKIDGAQVLDNVTFEATEPAKKNAAVNQAGVYTYKVAENVASAFKTAGTHEVVLYNVVSANFNPSYAPTVAPVLFGTYTVTNEAIAPAVTAATAKGPNTFFLSTNTDVDLTKSSLKVTKGNIVFANEGDKDATGAVVVPGTKFDNAVTVQDKLTIVSAYAGKDENGKPGIWVVVGAAKDDANGLYQGQEVTSTINVELTNYTALKGNLIGQKYAGSVTLAKDDNKPKVVKTDLTKEGVATVQFAKRLAKIEAGKNNLTNEDIVLRDKDGVIIPLTAGQVKLDAGKPADGTTKEVTGSLVITGLDKDKAPYTAEIKNGKFANLVQSSTGTSLSAYTATAVKNDKLTVSIGLANDQEAVSPYYAFNVEEKKTDANGQETGTVESKPGSITIEYGKEMSTTALDLANYTLDGKALPTGTQIDFYGSKEVVRITLPEESYATTAKQLLTINSNVTTALGSKVVNNLVDKATATGLVQVTDNIAPKLTKALYHTKSTTVDAQTVSNVIELTFSENVRMDDAIDAAKDFKVEVQDAEIAVSSITAGDEANQLKLTLAQDININQGAKITVKAETASNTINVFDYALVNDIANSNKVQAGSSVTTSGYEYGVSTP